MTSVVRTIPVALIDAGDRLRMKDPAWVLTLAEDIRQGGLQEPIRLVERGDRFRLISGARRLAAVQLLGHDKVRARVAPERDYADEAAIRLGEIKADMLRGELVALDFAVYVAEWCGFYREAQGPQKRGRKPAQPVPSEGLDELSAKLALNWTEAAQTALQIGRRTIFRSLKIAAIAPELRARIALHPVANNQSELIVLADQDLGWQVSIVDMLTEEPTRAETVSQALTLLQLRPVAENMPVYVKMSERFARLPASEQAAFFALHEDAIRLWIANSGSKPRKAGAL